MSVELNEVTATGIVGGRVTTLLPDAYESARSVRVIDEPQEGNLTVNPDNSLALVLTGTDYTGPLRFTVEVVDANGNAQQQTVSAQVSAPSQQAGWGTGANHYMLETDEDGELVLETGSNHREVYVSASNDALTLADIAAIEGLPVSAITGEWLVDNPEYGSNPGNALAQDAGSLLWTQLTRADRGAEPSSHWLRLEKGYSYDGFSEGANDLFPHGMHGEDELHPIVITSYGEGEQPIIATIQSANRDAFSNVVVHDLHFAEKINLVGPVGSDSQNIIFDSVTFTEQGGLSVIRVDGFTLRDANYSNISEDSPSNGSYWRPSPDRDHGIYASESSGFLIEDSNFVQIGWEDGYTYNGRSAAQAPSMFTHNVYMNASVRDLTFRDNISAEASSYGANLRSGGFVEDNLFFENNGGVVVSGGDWNGSGQVGNFSLISGNVVTSAGFKDAAQIGVLARGISNDAAGTTMIDNIVAHQTNPDDHSSQDRTHGGQTNNFDPFYNDTVVYNWFGNDAVQRGTTDSYQRNIDGLDTRTLDQTTIDNLAKIVLNNSNADANDLADWISENDVSADELNAYFQRAFNVLGETRTDAREIRFVPNEVGDGVRWDNRINWDSGDVPGTIAGDSVDLAGNWVVYGGTNTINNLDFGDGGQLDFSHGRLNVAGDTTVDGDGGTVNISAAGQFWMQGNTAGNGVLNISQDGGRFANTGNITDDVNLFIDDGQALLSAEGGDFTLGAGERLTVRGADTQVGFDGATNQEGVIRFNNDSEVIFASDSSGLGQIEEFRSGAYGDSPRVNSRIELRDTDLTVDLSGMNVANGTYVLMRADQLVGEVEDFNVTGLAGNRSATLIIDYDSDMVQLQLGSGSGTSVRTIGTNEGYADIPTDTTGQNTLPTDETPTQEPSTLPTDETPTQEPSTLPTDETSTQEPSTPPTNETSTQEPSTPPTNETPTQEPSTPPEAEQDSVRMEFGTETVRQPDGSTWFKVTFEEEIPDAVVVMGPLQHNGGDDAVVRVKNVTSTGFEFQIDEWDVHDGVHIAESVSWMAISAGTHELASGQTIAAGSAMSERVHETSVNVGLEGFDETPAIFTQVASFNGESAVTTRIKSVDENAFEFLLQEEEGGDNAHNPERVDWIAIEGDISGLLDVSNVRGGLDHNSKTHTFDEIFDDTVLLASMQTFNGGDTASIRFDDLEQDSVDLVIAEERSQDKEVFHVREDVAVLTGAEGSFELLLETTSDAWVF